MNPPLLKPIAELQDADMQLAVMCMASLGPTLSALAGEGSFVDVSFAHRGCRVEMLVTEPMESVLIAQLSAVLDSPIEVSEDMAAAFKGISPEASGAAPAAFATGRLALAYMCTFALTRQKFEWLEAATEGDPVTGTMRLRVHAHGVEMGFHMLPPACLAEEDLVRPVYH